MSAIINTRQAVTLDFDDRTFVTVVADDILREGLVHMTASSSTWMTPLEARTLATLLLASADRADEISEEMS